MTNQTEIGTALRTLGVTSQTLLARIRTALERGLVDEALAQLAFVDELVATRDETELAAVRFTGGKLALGSVTTIRTQNMANTERQ